jgi:hypothetical protein
MLESRIIDPWRLREWRGFAAAPGICFLPDQLLPNTIASPLFPFLTKGSYGRHVITVGKAVAAYRLAGCSFGDIGALL